MLCKLFLDTHYFYCIFLLTHYISQMVDINNLFKEKEFYDLVNTKAVERALPIGYNDYDFFKNGTEIELLQLQGHQLFIKNLFNPHTAV